ncbi:serine hydrolase [Pseudoalteromonas xiamenensis]|uniref:Serine hydrolase n=2 Tax=Pseudoalteromonas xiamenensis TaxID=882626 RepID=A0A975HM12_9GAMM|nr:serine hydrolase [Pseudoalteromonas xiamenensis]
MKIGTQSLSRIALGACLAMSSLSTSWNVQAAVNVGDVDIAVKAAMKAFNIPGIAIGVVENGKVVMAKGYGVTHLETQAPVNENTLFGIASNSKAFTATALAMLVDEGKLNWDDKVIQHLPEFQLADPYVTREMTIRDLLSHRSGLGLGAGDLMIWPDTNKSMKDILAGLKYLKPVSSFRTQYAYNNLMFVTAGEVVARVSGKPWAEFIETRILAPLKMNNSHAGFSRIPKTNKNFATGHVPYEGKLHPFFVDYLEDFQGAGAIASSAKDMSQWLLTQLSHGVAPSGERIFTEEQQQQLWQPHIMRTVSQRDFESTQRHFVGYGLGFAMEDYFGLKKLGHGGGILGMVSHVAIIPEKQLGVVILSNQQAYPALAAIANEVFEDALKLEDRDWVSELSTSYKEKKQKAYSALLPKPIDVVQASLPTEFYTGTLKSDWYGDVVIEKLDKTLRIDFTHTPLLKGMLQHRSGHTFLVKWDQPLLEAEAFITFEVDENQKVIGAKMRSVNNDITDFSFDFHDLDLKAK